MPNLSVMKPIFEKHKFKFVVSFSYTHEFMWPTERKYIYLKRTRKISVVFAEDDIKRPFVVCGLEGKKYFNSNLKEFKKEINKGRAPEHCGIAFDLKNSQDVERLFQAYCGVK